MEEKKERNSKENKRNIVRRKVNNSNKIKKYVEKKSRKL